MHDEQIHNYRMRIEDLYNLISGIESYMEDRIKEAEEKGASVPNYDLHKVILNGGFSFVDMIYINAEGKEVDVSAEELLSAIEIIKEYKDTVEEGSK